MGHRLPTILGKAIDDVIKTMNEQHEEDKIVDLEHCVQRMEALMSDLTSKADLRPIIDDGEGDIPLWNKALAKYFRGTTYCCSLSIRLLTVCVAHRPELQHRTMGLRRGIQVPPSSRVL